MEWNGDSLLFLSFWFVFTCLRVNIYGGMMSPQDQHLYSLFFFIYCIFGLACASTKNKFLLEPF